MILNILEIGYHAIKENTFVLLYRYSLKQQQPFQY